ncbi:MAG: hypothetical protein RL217_1438 [Pseudomonadota bacterium]|jgi:diguanylate cyclase (GGDEF)-like protein
MPVSTTNNHHELIQFIDEPDSQTTATTAPAWRVLLVDDDPDVHAATQLAMKNTLIEGRTLHFTQAYSAAQAQELLQKCAPFAVAMIDVVMETDNAGLQLVRFIREELKNSTIRIILRTGQPGYAPEMATIHDYDINDYRTKTDLTQTRLFTSLTMAIRAYAQIQQIEASRRGLEQILEANSELSRPVGLHKFANGLVLQLCALLQIDAEALVCAAIQKPNEDPYILAAAGHYENWIGLTLDKIPNEKVKQQLQQLLDQHRHNFTQGAGLYFNGTQGQNLAAFVDTAHALNDSEKQLLKVFCSNMSTAFANVQLYQSISELAYTDNLVNLPNRNALIAALDASTKTDRVLALLDIDNFADINSILDDSFGDAVLQAVAQRLQHSFSDATLQARLGSDLFGLYGDSHSITPHSIAQAFYEPVLVNNNEPLRVSVTSGLVFLTDENRAGVEIIKNAGIALKQAKRLTRGKALYFKNDQSHAARDRIQLLNQLRSSIAEQQLNLYYQPFVRLADKKVIGAECLLRWRTPDGKFIPPDTFIPIAEQSGLMVAIGEWVIRTALNWRLSMNENVDDDFRVAINVSHAQFAEPNFVSLFLGLLKQSSVPGKHVEIELTESIAIESFEQLSSKLKLLQDADVHLSMDDFGTGFSSLNVLQKLNLNRLKIDRAFISGSGENTNHDMADTIITMARHLKLRTIAEGIETAEQEQSLLDMGCQDGQGYYFAKPMPEVDFNLWLTTFTEKH